MTCPIFSIWVVWLWSVNLHNINVVLLHSACPLHANIFILTVFQLVQNALKCFSPMHSKLGPEELDQWVLEKFLSLHRTVLHEYADEVVLNVLEMRCKLCLKLFLYLSFRYHSGALNEGKDGKPWSRAVSELLGQAQRSTVLRRSLLDRLSKYLAVHELLAYRVLDELSEAPQERFPEGVLLDSHCGLSLNVGRSGGFFMGHDHVRWCICQIINATISFNFFWVFWGHFTHFESIFVLVSQLLHCLHVTRWAMKASVVHPATSGLTSPHR